MLRAGRLSALMMPTMMLSINACSVAVLWIGSKGVESGTLTVGGLVAFLGYLGLILMSVMMATFVVMQVPRASVCASRIQQLLDLESSVVAPPAPVAPTQRTGEVELRGVSFSYPGAESPALTEVSFHAVAGETTAIIGSTGAGKTSLMNLIPRMFDITAGAILVDGVDVRDLDPEILRHRIGLVPQRPYLFSARWPATFGLARPTRRRRSYGPPSRSAQAADFVRAAAGGLESAVAQGGTNLSGGQRQRLSIARARFAAGDLRLRRLLLRP